MKQILLALLLPLAGLAQQGYVAQKSTDLTAAAEVITVQQPASGSRFVKLKSAYIDCSVACTVTLERNGSRASSTTLTPANINPGETAASATAWSSSNVGTGSVLQVVSIGAGSAITFDLGVLDTIGVNLIPNNSTSNNFTVRTSSITGTVHITIKWSEQ